MINREDMLELTRRMNPSRTSFTRIAGSYIDSEGYMDGTFNTNFLNLKMKDKQNNLAIAKAIPFAETNENLKEFTFSKDNKGNESIWQLLQGMNSCGLKNDALMEIFYELVSEKYQSDKEYAIFVFHDCYDVPLKGTDKVRLGESEEVYEYIICAICPLTAQYELGSPECGFLFPSFCDRSCDIHRIAIFHKDKNHPHLEIEEMLQVLPSSEEQ